MVDKAPDSAKGPPAEKEGFRARVKQTIGELLVAEGLIKPEQVEEALSIQKTEGRRIVQTLVDLGHIDVVTFAKFLASRRGVPSINLSHYEIQPELCALIPQSFAREHEVFPVDRLGKLLTVGMVSPLDSDTLDQLREITGLQVKAVLCSSEDINGAITRHYGETETPGSVLSQSGIERKTEQTLKIERIAGLVLKVGALPTLPQTVQKVQEACENPDMPLQEVADIVAFDPPISAQLLQIANSAAYGLSTQVDNVLMAVRLMGLEEVYSIVAAAAIVDLVGSQHDFDHETFWENSRFCALAAKNISNTTHLTPAPGLFTSGLLLDIGRYALSEMTPRQYANVDAELMGADLVDEEERLLGIAHPEVGYLLANHWGLPADIAECIRFHHTPELAGPHDNVAIAALASFMTDAFSQGLFADEEVLVVCEQAVSKTRLEPETALLIYLDTVEAYRESAKPEAK